MVEAVHIAHEAELLGRGIGIIVQEMGWQVSGLSTTARDAMTHIVATQPQIAIVGSVFPDGTALEVCREVMTRLPQLSVIIVTDGQGHFHDSDSHAATRSESSLLPRACSYISAGTSVAHFRGCLQRAQRGETVIDLSATERRSTFVSLPTGEPNLLEELTPQEGRVLDLLIEGLTNRQIGRRLNIAEKTVKNHLTSVMAKLRVERRTQAAIYGARVRGFARSTGATGSPEPRLSAPDPSVAVNQLHPEVEPQPSQT